MSRPLVRFAVQIVHHAAALLFVSGGEYCGEHFFGYFGYDVRMWPIALWLAFAFILYGAGLLSARFVDRTLARGQPPARVATPPPVPRRLLTLAPPLDILEQTAKNPGRRAFMKAAATAAVAVLAVGIGATINARR